MLTFVAEVNRKLFPKELEIWEGRSSLPLELQEAYRRSWRGERPLQPNPKTASDIKITLPCINRSELPNGKSIPCRCASVGPLEVFSCKIHGETTLSQVPKSNSIKCCKFCTDREGPDDARMREEFNHFAANIPADPHHYSCQGITIAAGGKYWASAYVTIRMIRHTGCELPIYVGFLGGSKERDERYEDLLEPYNVKFIDIDQHPARQYRRGVKSFQTKLFMALNSPFEEVLSLDPDNYPCSDPTVLFEDERYKKIGAIYWPDTIETNSWTNWKIAGVTPYGPPCGFETGQYVLNKRKVWEPMLLAEWLDDHSEWTYGGAGGIGGLDYGDKGPPRLAFAKLKRDVVVFNPVNRYEKFAFLQPGPDGKTPMFVHRCHSKWMAEGMVQFTTTSQKGENMRGGLPMEEVAFGYLEELKSKLPSRIAVPHRV